MNNSCKNYLVIRNNDPYLIADLAEELNMIPSKDGRKSQLFNFIQPNPYQEDFSEESNDWKLENWGTDSEAEVTDFYYDEEKDPYSITITFYTDWCPPIELYYYLVSEGWEVDSMFHEPENCFVGMFKNNQETYFDYDMGEGEKFLDSIPEDLIKFGELRNRYKMFLKQKETFFDESDNGES